jgi:hypothetical protein
VQTIGNGWIDERHDLHHNYMIIIDALDDIDMVIWRLVLTWLINNMAERDRLMVGGRMALDDGDVVG